MQRQSHVYTCIYPSVIRKISNNEHKNHNVSKNIFLECEMYRMLFYLPCGLSAERSNIARKAHIIRFFSVI